MAENETVTKDNKKHDKKRVLIVIAFLIIFAVISFINYRSEYLQIKEIGEEYTSVFQQNITYKYAITGTNFVAWFIAIYITNKFIKKGLKTFFDEEKKEMPKLPNKSIALIMGSLVSLFTSDILISKAILFLNSTWFGSVDPIFGQDIGYYMFQKPFIELILLYFMAMIIALAIYTVVYYIIAFNVYFDGIELKTLKKNTFVKQMISFVILIAICLSFITMLKTQDILFEEFIELEDIEKTTLTGAGFIDVTVKLWGYRIFAIVILVCIILAVRFFLKEKYKKAIISVLSIPAYLIGLFIVITGFQVIFVNPNVLDKEKTYIGYNIENTKKAYNIDIEEIELENSGTITEELVNKYQNTINNIPIVNEEMTLTTLQEYQDSVGFYTYENTKIQNYTIEDKETSVYVTPREIVTDDVNRTYDNKTYNYTHGYGSILTSVSKTDVRGGLEYIQVDFTGKDEKISLIEPRIYFGLKTNTSIVVNSRDKKEFDYPITTSTNAENIYNGEAGLNLGFWDKLIVGIDTNNLNLAFTDKNSKIILNRNIIERAKTLMPYLIYDENPYLVITDEGKQVWVLDAYTVSDSYPYSQKTMLETNNAKTKINYIRNSVKVLIDAYDGTVKFYITDRTDPIVMAYLNMYEDLFAKEDETIPNDIAKHITYPELLYEVQSKMYQRYHKVQTEVLYRNDDLWEIARFNTSKVSSSVGTTMEAYYTMVKTVDSEECLGLVIPYTSYGKQNIVSYLVGTYDAKRGSKLTLYKFASGSNVLGPAQLNQQIEQDETISLQLESLNKTGSKTNKNMVIVPIEDTLLYVEPIYQVLLNEKSQVQTLAKVIVASGNKVAIGDTLQEAISNLLSKYAVNIEVENTDSEEDLINAIIKANQNLEESSGNSDWEMMGKDIKKLQELIFQLEALKEETNKNTVTNDIITNEIINEISSNILE